MPVFIPPGVKAFPSLAYVSEEGVLAVGGDMTRDMLERAYRVGIFPWYDKTTPPLWWSPPTRCMLRPEEMHIPRSLRRVINARRFSLTLDTAFSDVMARCAAVHEAVQGGTWIMPEMLGAYADLHAAGLAHSIEAWQDGVLVGGLYGVSLGRAFFGESMFFSVPDASKVAFVWLGSLLRAWGFTLIDCQQVTDNLLRFGAYPVSRDRFMALLADALTQPDMLGPWRMPDGFFPLN